MKKIVAIASIPSRETTLIKVINSLSPQADLVLVWLNGYTQPPKVSQDNVYFYLSKDNVGDVGKFAVVDKFINKSTEEFYLFTCDDDIAYPSDYIQNHLKFYKEDTIQSFHGKTFPQIPLERLISEYPSFYFANALEEKVKLHLGGTGVMLMDYNIFRKLPYDTFNIPNMCDVWVAGFAHVNSIPIYTIPRKHHWLKPYHSPESIWDNTKGRDTVQTQTLNHYLTN